MSDVTQADLASYRKWRRETTKWRNELRKAGNFCESSFLTTQLERGKALADALETKR